MAKKSFLPLFGFVAFGLIACSPPNAMPTGYSYHQDTYKYPPPPMPRNITDLQRQYMSVTQAENFRDGIYDLLSNLTMRAGMPPKPVYVLSPELMTNFYTNIDNDLRESMRHIGYALSDQPEGAYIFTYDAALVQVDNTQEVLPAGAPNVTLTLNVYDKLGQDARLLSSESGDYYIYGADALNVQPATYVVYPEVEK